MVVDNDPRKRGFLPGYTVMKPEEAIEQLRRTPVLCLLLNSCYHKECIAQASRVSGRIFEAGELILSH